ncbi:MAG TPA: NUDIX hydrolase [Nitriliruptorales bacterium]|nr:NUDIX hydrolase [Nitriliruptorales bacterium]
MPDGSVGEREVVEQPDAVGVVPLAGDGTVLLLRQYRHPFGEYMLEIPAGKLDREGEDPQEAAARELTEETGFVADRLEPLFSFRNSAGWTDEVTHLYLARGLSNEGLPADFTPKAEEADMEVVRMPLADALAAVRDGTISDAKTVIGLLLSAGPAGSG